VDFGSISDNIWLPACAGVTHLGHPPSALTGEVRAGLPTFDFL
jgi:hypothetical protein